MRYVLFIFALFASIITSVGVAQGAPAKEKLFVPGFIATDRLEREFINSPVTCKINGTCDLKRVIMRSQNFSITRDPNEPNDAWIHGTQILAGLETDTIDHLTNYAFVQFIRGCMWYSQDQNGQIVTEFGVVRNFLGIKRIQHILPRWVVDTDDIDPVYGADRETGNRHYFLQSLDKIPSWIPGSQGKLFGEEPFTIPFGYVTDHPGPALYEPKHKQARNMSLEFEMCLFKTADVPATTNGIDIDKTKALVCFPWEAKHVFDHRTQVFHTGGEISKECKRPFTAREKFYHDHVLELNKTSAEQ